MKGKILKLHQLLVFVEVKNFTNLRLLTFLIFDGKHMYALYDQIF